MAFFGILFDMDGVIIDSNPYHKKALDIFLEKYGIHISESERKTKLYGRANKDWIREIFGGSLTDSQVNELGDEKEKYWRELYADAITPVEGLRSFLDHLQVQKVPMAIGTSAPLANVEFTLRNCNLQSYFNIILHQEHVVKGKPDPEIYIKCAQALGLPAASCIVIEDSMAGVAAGLAAGCKVIGITTTHSADELKMCNYIIQDFNDLDIFTLEQIFAST